MKNKILYIAGAVVIVVVVLFIILNFKNGLSNIQNKEVTTENIATSTSENILTKVGSSTQATKVQPISVKDIAWAVFQKYLTFNKNKNLEGVKSIVYKVAPVCADPKTIVECEGRMASAYSYGSVLKKEDFTNVWSDNRQIILATDFWTESAKEIDQYGRFRSIIFFIKGADGEWKLLSFSPTKGGATSKGDASQAEVDSKLVTYTEDKDKDGMPDYDEQCLGTSTTSACIKTDPKLRDTNGNGLWDGVEALMK
jgi:hypothetical protein